MSDLTGQVALITGASSGIGKATACLLASQGMALALNGRRTEPLEKLQALLAEGFPEAKTLLVPADVRDANAVDQMVSKTVRVFGQLDVLINNAGVASKTALLQEVPPEEIDRLIDINLKGAIYVMQAVLRQAMVPAGQGVIINLNSVAGLNAYPYWSLYDATKFGLRAITEAVAEEQRTNGIKVMGIYPGAVDTPLWDALEPGGVPDRDGMLDVETIADLVLHTLQQPAKAFTSAIHVAPLNPAV